LKWLILNADLQACLADFASVRVDLKDAEPNPG
jgi:hypothetical protein